MKTTFRILLISLIITLVTSCYPVPRQQMGGRPYPSQNPSGFQQGLQRQQGGQRRLESFTVRRAHFQANIDSRHAGRRQEVSDRASAYFEETGRVISDQQLSREFGFECHVRLVGPIQARKVRPDEVPVNIRAKFSN